MNLQNRGAEQWLLGRFVLEPSVLALCGLGVDDFYFPSHQLIYSVMQKLCDKGNPLDLVFLQHELEQAGTLKQAGGMLALVSLTDNTNTMDDPLHYAGVLKELTALRRLQAACQNIQMALKEPGSSTELLAQAEAQIYTLTAQQQRGTPPLHQLVSEFFTGLETRGQTHGLTGLPTGITKLDQMTAGLQPGDLVVLAARPSMGKTAFALHLAYHAAKAGQHVAFFSMEMGAEQLVHRLMGMLSLIDLGVLRSGRVAEWQWNTLIPAGERLANLPLHLDDTSSLSLADLRSRCRKLAAQRPLGLVVVDYLQLMRGEQVRGGSREQEISSISRGLKQLARELKCPVVALSQLNRSLEQRQNRRPMMSDLRESGAIEQDADVILFLYRHWVYARQTDPLAETNDALKRQVEIIISKQRNGGIGTVQGVFIPEHGLFANPAPDQLRDWIGEPE